MSSAPSQTEIDQALARLRAAIAESGLILSHDTKLPSATALVAGIPVPGSWWGHPKGKLIYEVLSALGSDVAWVKLVKGKDTIVERRLWPALIRVGSTRQSWQLERLGEDARSVLLRIDGAAEPLRSDQLELPPGSRKLGVIVTELERRLLVHTDSIHTEGGHHVRVLESWSRWQERFGIPTAELPEIGAALEALTRAARTALATHDVSRLLPWPDP